MWPTSNCPTSPRAVRLTTSRARSAWARVKRASTSSARPASVQLDPTVRPVEQAAAEVLLEATDLLAEWRLRDVQALRRPTEVQLFRDRHEVLQVA